MFSFFQALLAVLIAGSAGTVPAKSASALWESVLESLCLILVPFLLGRIVSRRNRFLRPLTILFPVSPILAYSVVIFWADWSSVVATLPLPNSEFLRHFFLLCPFFLLQFAYWSEIYRLERRSVPSRASYLNYQFRALLFTLAPVALYLIGADVLVHFRQLRLVMENISLARMGATLAFMLLLVVLIPLAARYFWRTYSLPEGPLRQKLNALSQKLDFRCRDILIWKTEGLTINAAILGLFTRFRYVILTDGILAVLSEDEIQAVFGHELGHAKRHHVTHFFLFAMSALLLFLLITEFLLPQTELALLLATAPFLILLWSLFGYLSRRFELEADLYGAAATGSMEHFILALEKVGVHSGQGRWHGSWRHFSVGKRIEFLNRIALEPKLGEKFLRKLKNWSRAGIAIFIATILLYGFLLYQKLPVEQAQLDLANGRYEAAIEKLQSQKENPDARKVFEFAELGRRFQQVHGAEWRSALLKEGRDYFLRKEFKASNALFGLAVLLDEGGEKSRQLEIVSAYLARRDLDNLRHFIESDGAPLLEDPEIAAVIKQSL